MKKALIIFALFCSALLGVISPVQTYAIDGDCTTKFLGLPAWYDGLVDSTTCEIKAPAKDDDGAELKKFIWTIVMNIISLVIGVVGYLAVAFVIYGGFQYLTSSGDPGRAAKGKKTITNALVGTVICVLSSMIMSAISGIISGAAQASTPAAFFTSIFNYVLIWGGILCVIMIVISGIEYAISIGNPGKVSKAKNTIIYAAVGLIIIILAAAIVNFVLEAL